MSMFDRKIVLVFVQLQLLFIGGKWTKFLSSSSELRESAGSLENICLTPGCVEAAAQILNYINDTVDPCDDFYQFACGGWQDRHIIPDHMSAVSVMSELQNDIDIKLKVLLEKPLTDDDPYFVKLLKTMLYSCLDVKKIESLKEKPLETSLENIGGWPVVLGNKWNESEFDWMDTLIKFSVMGFKFNSLFSIFVGMELNDNTKYNLVLDEPYLGLPDRGYYLEGLNNRVSSAYFDYMEKVAIHFGADKHVAQQELAKVFEFETNLAKITWPVAERRNYAKKYNMFTIKQLQELCPKVDWLKVINGITGKQITEDELILVRQSDFAKKFSNIIASTDKRTIANYLVWRIIQYSIPLLSKEWRDLSQGYVEALLGKVQEPPRWGLCIFSLKSGLAVALGSYYVQNYFKEESKEAAKKMVGYVLKEFIKILETADWMKGVTRAKAIEKAKSITTHIGYPNAMRNDTAVNEYYAGLQLDKDSFYENTRKLKKFAKDTLFNRLGKAHTKGMWDEFAVEITRVNAFNILTQNTIMLPAGILKGVYFRMDRPNYLNYGGIGYVIGHEITHGFDNRGKQYDKNGNYKNWWDPETNERFNKKVQCIIEQYNNYTVKDAGVNINGIITEGENIADNGGVREAYKAYHTWVAENGVEKRLPGLKYTPSQLFWINTANVWCNNIRPEAMKLNVLTRTHSPAKYRVIGSLSDSQEFAQDFNCPSGSRMNPVNKCQVW